VTFTQAVSPFAMYTWLESIIPMGNMLGLLRARSQFEISLFNPYSATAKLRCSTSALRVPRYSWFDVKYIPDIMTPRSTTPNSALMSATPFLESSADDSDAWGSTAFWFCIDYLT
jgi:hypothetical protein